MSDPSKKELPLGGIRVADWTVFQTGPSATQLLADLGAEVIKIEDPKGGDYARGSTRDAGSFLNLPHGLPYGFECNNRNKKSLAVDVTKEKGKEIVYQLVKNSDVFVQNFRVGVAERLKMDYATLVKYNPSLIYAHCSGYGKKGPLAQKPALDPAIHASSGMMLGIGEEGMPPIHLPGAISDQTTGIMLAFGIMAALYYREKTGIGQEVDVAMLGTMIWVQTNNILYSLLAQKPRERQRRDRAKNPLVNHYRCKDNRWLLLAHFQPDKYWTQFCRALGKEELIHDPRFATLKDRENNAAALIAILDEVFATKTRDEWMEVFSKEDLIFSPIKDYWEVICDTQVWENDFLTYFNHPELGEIREIGIPVKLSKTPGTIREPAPQLGQHTEAILIDLLGYTWEEVEMFRDEGVIL